MGLCISKPVAAATAVDLPVEKKATAAAAAATDTKEASDRSLKRLFDKDVQEEEEGGNGQLKRIPEEQEEQEEHEKVEPTNEEKVGEKVVPVEIEEREFVLDELPTVVDKEAVAAAPVEAPKGEQKGGSVQEQSKTVEERPSTPERSESKSEVAAGEADVAAEEFKFDKPELVTQDSEKFELIVKQVSEKFEIPGVPEPATTLVPDQDFEAKTETVRKDETEKVEEGTEAVEETSPEPTTTVALKGTTEIVAVTPEAALEEEFEDLQADQLTSEPAQVEQEPSEDIKVAQGEQGTTEGGTPVVSDSAGAAAEDSNVLGVKADDILEVKVDEPVEPANGGQLLQEVEANDEPTTEAPAAEGEIVESETTGAGEEQAEVLEMSEEVEKGSKQLESAALSSGPVGADKSEPVAQEISESEPAKVELPTEDVPEPPAAGSDQSKTEAPASDPGNPVVSEVLAQPAEQGQVEATESQKEPSPAPAADQEKVEVPVPDQAITVSEDKPVKLHEEPSPVPEKVVAEPPAEAAASESKEEAAIEQSREAAAAGTDDPSDSGRKDEFFETSEQMPDAESSEAIDSSDKPAVKN